MSRSIYVLTQYGQVFGAFSEHSELVEAVKENIARHLYGEYRVAHYYDGVYGDPPVVTPLKEFMQ